MSFENQNNIPKAFLTLVFRRFCKDHAIPPIQKGGGKCCGKISILNNLAKEERL
jgi:hypothetical protein